MQVILNDKVEKLGKRGDICEVKPGYFMNFLYPKGLADIATEAILKLAKSRNKNAVLKKQEIIDNAKEVLNKLKGFKIVIKKKASDKGKLYAAITEEDVIAIISKEKNVELGSEFIKMEHFKEIGEHKIQVNLGKDLSEKIDLLIEAE